MTFQLKATLAFTDSCPTIDPVSYNPVSEEAAKGDWHRLTRTMKGERNRHIPILTEWDTASTNARNLAEAADELADTRFWFKFQVLPGLWNVLGNTPDLEPTVKGGVLVVLLMEDGWSPEREPKDVYVDWLNSAIYAYNPNALTARIKKTLTSCRSMATRKSIEAYAIDTETGARRQLDIDAAAFTEPAPAIA